MMYNNNTEWFKKNVEIGKAMIQNLLSVNPSEWLADANIEEQEHFIEMLHRYDNKETCAEDIWNCTCQAWENYEF